VVPYPFIEKPLSEINSESLNTILSFSKLYGNDTGVFKYGSDCMVFYTIGEWNDRNNIEDTLKCFCKAFTKEDNVRLILKVYHTNYTTNNKLYCKYNFESVIKKFPNHPEILLITENISQREILLIHSIGNCFFSLTRGEGFCLDVWDAFNYKNNIVITKFGGHNDYLGNDYEGYVNCDLVNVRFKEKENLYSGDQRWANPDIQSAINKLKEVYSRFDKSNTSVSYSINKVVENEVNPSNSINSGKDLVFENLKLNISELEVKNSSEFSGITYIGQYGTSGYATAAKGNLIHFFTKGVPISWIPLYFDNSKLSDECFYNTMANSLIKKPIEQFDTVFIHATPDIWPELREKYKNIIKDKNVIGYTVWETSKLPYLWVESINECVNEVWCPSTYNKEVFENSGVNIPIKVFPHIFMPKELPPREFVFLNKLNGGIIKNESKYYTFYNISELNPRKGVEDLVKTFCEAFTSRDKVRLILKVHYKNYEEQNKKYCINCLNNIISSYEDPPVIHIISNNLTEMEILGLHSIGDCYVSLCKSEGFGLTIFEAFKYGKKVVTTGYSGHIDFLGEEYEGLVKYTIGDVVGMESFSKFYSDKDQQWAYPDLKHAKELMIKTSK
jgi:glycosyltransferase involved in cell wall biosynthesis